MASTRCKLDEIVGSFSTLEDPRSHINRRHPLPSVLVIAVLAVLAGAAWPTAIARWARFKEDLLAGILDLPNGVPAKDVFRRVLMALKPEAFEAAFNAWIARLRDEAVAETGVGSVENAGHWSLDVTFREDDSRVRERVLGTNITWLHRFTLSILKQHPTGG